MTATIRPRAGASPFIVRALRSAMSEPAPSPTHRSSTPRFAASSVGPMPVASGRIGRIVVAYVLAVAAAAVLRTVGLVVEETWVRGFDRLVAVNGWSSLLVVPAMTALIGFVAAAPVATAVLVVAEARGMRVLWGYALAGGAIAALTRFVVTLPFGLAGPTAGLVALETVAGIIAGWVYWLVAIRSAPPPPPADPWAET